MYFAIMDQNPLHSFKIQNIVALESVTQSYSFCLPVMLMLMIIMAGVNWFISV